MAERRGVMNRGHLRRALTDDWGAYVIMQLRRADAHNGPMYLNAAEVHLLMRFLRDVAGLEDE
jgi:hypothetical protein